jgi:CheY-like chemotaxis protein
VATQKAAEINPNAILLDLDMVDTISGISLAYRLKKTSDTAKIPIIAFASNLSEAQSELDRYGDTALEAYIHRDFTEMELATAIQTVEAYWYLAQTK